MSGRRAALRVAFRTSNRNKKRTFYLVLLIAMPVMVAAMTSVFVRASYISPEESATLEYGAANVAVSAEASNPAVDEWVAEEIDELAPGAERLEYRADYIRFGENTFGRVSDLDLDNPLSDGILTLFDGRPPSAADEVVLTEHLATVEGWGIGDSVEFEGAPGSYEVVGLASNPLLWKLDEAVLASPGMDEFAAERQGQPGRVLLLSADDDQKFADEYGQDWQQDRYDFYPSNREWPMPDRYWFMPEDYYAAMSDEEIGELDRLLDESGDEAAMSYMESLFMNGYSSGLPNTYVQSRSDQLMWSNANLAETGPAIGTAVAAIILAEVAFIAGAAFATGTRRRLREIGLLGANGASIKHVRTTVMGEGFVVGLVGGLLGSLLAFALVALGRSTLQQFVDRRIDEFPFSLADIGGPILVAVMACVIAAWVPARTASGVPTLTALQGRMPVGAPRSWVIPIGLGLTAFGTLLLGVGLAGGSGVAGAVAVIGAVLMIGGVALLAGPMVAWISKHAEKFPVTPRIVLRDSGRQRGRAAAAVAATMVILMAPVGVLTTLQQSEASQDIQGLTPTGPEVFVYGSESDTGEPMPLDDGDLTAIETAAPGSVIAAFDAIDVPVRYPAELDAGTQAESQGQYYVSPFRVSVANDEYLAFLDDRRLETALNRDGIAILGVEQRETTIEIDGQILNVAEVPVAVPVWEFPRVVVTESYAEKFVGAETRRSALVEVKETWLESINPFHEPARPMWRLRLFVNGGGADVSSQQLFALVFLATILIVLIVVATITALSAAEADNDLRTMVAVGAPNRIRRRYLGLQSGLHTLLGCVLAIPLTLILMRTAYSSAVGSYTQVGAFGVFDSTQLFIPWRGLAGLVLGVPLTIGLITALAVRSAPTTPPRRAS